MEWEARMKRDTVACSFGLDWILSLYDITPPIDSSNWNECCIEFCFGGCWLDSRDAETSHESSNLRVYFHLFVSLGYMFHRFYLLLRKANHQTHVMPHPTLADFSHDHLSISTHPRAIAMLRSERAQFRRTHVLEISIIVFVARGIESYEASEALPYDIRWSRTILREEGVAGCWGMRGSEISIDITIASRYGI